VIPQEVAHPLEALSCWVLSVLVAIDKQCNRVSAIGACLVYVIDLELNIS
jgi:hypothetical protein